MGCGGRGRRRGREERGGGGAGRGSGMGGVEDVASGCRNTGNPGQYGKEVIGVVGLVLASSGKQDG